MEPSDKNSNFQAPIGVKELNKILPSGGSQDSSLYDLVTLYRGWNQTPVHECGSLLNGRHS